MLEDMTTEEKLRMELAGMEYLSDGKDQIFEILIKVLENFDRSDYEQGKKDGLRIALACLGDVGQLDLLATNNNHPRNINFK